MVKEKSKRAAYTLEFKREAVRLVEGGQGKAVTSKVLGVSASGYFERQVRLQEGTTRGTGTTQQVGRGRPRVGDEALLAHIKAAHAASKGEYGWPRA